MVSLKFFEKSCLTLTLIFVGFQCPLNAIAADKSEPIEYKFKSIDGAPSEQEEQHTKFKTPSSEVNSEKSWDQNSSNQNEHSYKSFVEYPRLQAEVGYTPMSEAFKQEYNGLPLNFSATSLSSVHLLGRFVVSPNFHADLEFNHSEFGIADKDLGVYKVVKSTAEINSLLGRLTHCDVFDLATDRFCYGAVFGMDAYPSLNFSNATDIQIAVIKDMVAGLSLGYQHNLFPNIGFSTALDYLIGLKLGQDSNLGVDSDNQYAVKANLNFFNSQNLNFFSLGGAYGYREAKVHGNTGSFSDTWTTKASSFSLSAQYTWTWQTNN